MPFENGHPLTRAIVENATLTAMNTPVGPNPKGARAPRLPKMRQGPRMFGLGVGSWELAL
jgi:hypothetical protein